MRTDVVKADSRSDGVLPLVTNSRDLSPLNVYLINRGNQPLVEKGHDLLKNTLHVMPAFLRSISRLEALLVLEYLAVTVHALVERQLRLKMAENHRNQLPLYPEARHCPAPTAERVFDIFEHLQTHTLWKEGRKIRTFPPRLTELQREALESLEISPLTYRDA